MTESLASAPHDGPEELTELRRQLLLLQRRVEKVEIRLGLELNVRPAATPKPAIAPLPDGPLYRAMLEDCRPQTPPAAPAEIKPISAKPSAKPTPETIDWAKLVPPIAAASPQPDEVAQVRPALDWESLIGGKWALWVGSLSLFLAMASFLALTWRLVPDWARLALGFCAGLSMLLGGGHARAKTQRWFSEGLSGAGLAICYLSLWAGTQLYHLLPHEAAFAAMAALTALGVYLAVRYDALSLSLLSTIGGFLTPVLLNSHGASGNSATLLAYVAVLDCGIVAVSLFKRWRALTWMSFLATILLMAAWTPNQDFSVLRTTIFSFFTIYFLLFFGAACFHSLMRKDLTADEDLALLFAVSTTYALAGYAVILPKLGTLPGTFPLAMALFFVAVGIAIRQGASENRPLRLSLDGLALLSVTIALPVQLKQSALAIGWTAEAAILILLGRRMPSEILLRAGQIVWLLSLWPLAFSLGEAPHPKILFINARALPLLFAVAAGFIIAFGEKRRATELRDDLTWLYATFAVWSGAWLLAQETFLAFQWSSYPTPQSWQSGALFVVAAVESCFAVMLFHTAGNRRTLKLNALMLALLAAALPVWAGMANAPSDWTPFWNLRTFSFAVVTTTWLMLARLIKREESLDGETSAMVPLVAAVLALVGASLEVYFGFDFWHRAGDEKWQAAAFFALTMLWSVYAALLLKLGTAWRDAALRGLACSVGFLALAGLLCNAALGELAAMPLTNWRFAAFATVIAACLFSTTRLRDDNSETGWPAQGEVLAILLGFWALTQEIFETCRFFKAELGQQWQIAATFYIVIFWQVSALAILIGGLLKRRYSWRILAYLLAGAGITLLLSTAVVSGICSWPPLFNPRGAAFFVTIAAWAAAARQMQLRANRLEPSERWLPGMIGLSAVFLLGWALTHETYEAVYFWRAPLDTQWTRTAQMTISLVWSLYGAMLLIAGVMRRYQPVRLAGLALLALTVCKVFVFDLSFLGGSLRVLSLGGLGIALIFISWLYGRFGAGME